MRREVPPTAGLPLRVADFWPARVGLEQQVAAIIGSPPLQLECSGTAALWVALLALRQRQPRRRVVVVPAYTCPLVAIAVRAAGLDLRLCDLLPDRLDLDPQMLASVCGEDTLAIVPTHLAGRVTQLEPVLAVARATGAYVVEDAAQALGARERGQSVGLRGDLGFFSLAAGKGLSIYEGGLLLARDAELRAELRQASARSIPHNGLREWRRCIELLGLAALYRPRALAFAYGQPLRHALRQGDKVGAVGDRFPTTIPLHPVGRWRQSVGANAARRLPAFLDQLAVQAHVRAARLRSIGIEVFDDPPGTQGTWPCLLLRLPDERCRDAVLARLWSAGLGVSRMFIHALPDYAYLADIVPPQDVPNARALAARTLTVSNSPWLGERAFDSICSVLASTLV